ncbi:MAG: B12-binding domain-containing radical SAM protein [Deltaproteobacteria bacterium RBG_19FT_COMBO_46_12]|nr:MAG: B12-binding domain-containing radical SAM protein [Deltaproteobacteria bacterium RBG_19FT_COMBO_46_12]
MRALFISANTEKITMPVLPLGLACVASSTKRAGYDVTMVDLEIERDTSTVLKEAIEVFCPDIIGISVRNIDDQRMENSRLLLDPIKEIVTLCRDLSEVPIVLGGAGYSIFPESALSFLGADMGIQGEGEVVFPELMRRIELGADLLKLPGLYLPGHGLQCERMFVKDQDQLPLPEPDLWPVLSKKEEIWLPVQTRRGCPLSCSYCSTGTIEGRTIRKRSPELVVQWIARWRKAGVERFYFVDNTFNLPPSYAKEVCRKLIDYDLNIRWWSIIYPKGVDEELVRLMVRSGCEHVSLGSESGSERILKDMNKRFTPKEVRQISEMISNHGINQMGFLLLGSPGETRESVKESLVFADSLRLDTLKITVGVRIYPHTPLAKSAENEGVISSKDNLLLPRFYLAKGLENWLPDTLKNWMVKRTHWMI